jgi:predicted DNA-binding antitoxin AbrB/MazE fold protein
MEQAFLLPLFAGGSAMTLMVEAVYENGLLKPAQPLPLKEHEKVRLAVIRESSVAEQTYGLLGWTGDAAPLERLLLAPEIGD